MILAPLPRLRVCAIWKMNTELELPWQFRVTLVGIVTPVDHL